MSPAPVQAVQALPSAIVASINQSKEPLHVQKLQAELEVAESELRIGRLRLAFIAAKEEADQEAKFGGGVGGTQDEPHDVD